MATEQNKSNYMSFEDYREEWEKSGGEGYFSTFLSNKAIDAGQRGEKELAEQIWQMCNDAEEQEAYQDYVDYIMEEDKREKAKIIEKYRSEWEETEGISFIDFLKQKQQEVVEFDDDFELEHHLIEICEQLEQEENTRQEVGQAEPDLQDLSLEELTQIAETNQKQIADNEQEIKQQQKQVLIDRILGQQQTIARQKAEIARLKSQKEL